MITGCVTKLVYEGKKSGLAWLSKATLEGMLLDAFGNPIPGCEIWLRGKRNHGDITAASGRFVLDGVHSGQYDIAVTSPEQCHTYRFFDKMLLDAGMRKVIEVSLPFNPASERSEIVRQEDDAFVGVNVLCGGTLLPKEGALGAQFIRATPGQEYSLIAHNYTTRRVLCVLTVDGLSVLDGQPGGFHSGGYVVDPGGVVEVKGWRIDRDRVARFIFAEKGRAYARLIDQPTDLGVISCAFFLEKPSEPEPLIRFRLADADDGPIGTGFGRAETQRVDFVDFDRETEPFYSTRILYIHSRESRPSAQAQRSNPFPGCRVPPGWKG
jgi:hypothetical protein